MNKSLIALVLAAVLAGCSSNGGSEPAQPQFDGDYGFENVDPNFGNGDSPDDGDNGFENVDPGYGKDDSTNIADIIEQVDLGFVYIPDLGDVPFFNKDTGEAHISAVKQRSNDEETLYSIYVDDDHVGEIIVREDYVTIRSGDKVISGDKKTYLDTEHTFWTVRDTNDNVIGDFKRLDDGVWVFREEMNRETFVVKYHDGQWNFIPVADIKNKVKDNLPSQAEVTKVRAKMQVNKLRTLK